MEEYSRPATLDDLKALVAALNTHGVDYLLIGGYALLLHGYSRTTIDIDLLVPTGRATGERLRQALMILPDKAARDLEPAWFDEGENIRVADDIVVDIIFNACGETFATLVGHVQTVDLDGVPVRTVDLEGLLRTKQSLREKDAPDRIVLERALAVLKQKGQEKA